MLHMRVFSFPLESWSVHIPTHLIISECEKCHSKCHQISRREKFFLEKLENFRRFCPPPCISLHSLQWPKQETRSFWSPWASDSLGPTVTDPGLYLSLSGLPSWPVPKTSLCSSRIILTFLATTTPRKWMSGHVSYLLLWNQLLQKLEA